MKKTTIAPGIYRDAHGFEVRAGRNVKPAWFDLDTPVASMQAWQRKQRRRVNTPPLETSTTRTGITLEGSLPRFLATIEAEDRYRSDRSHARAWLHATGADGVELGKKVPEAITEEDITVIVQGWKKKPSANAVRRISVQAYTRGTKELQGYERLTPITGGNTVAIRTIRHRIRVLRAWLRVVIGSKAENALDDFKAPPPPEPDPIGVDAETVIEVAENLLAKKAHHDTYARYLVLNATGQRPCQVMRTKPGDLHLTGKHPKWIVRTAKGDPAFPLALNPEMVRAWRVFIAAKAFGVYDTSLHGKRVHAAGWPNAVRPYNARHSVMIDALQDPDVTLDDVQAIAGHKLITTTQRFYARYAMPKQRAAVNTLTGRFADHFKLKRAK